MRTDQRAAGSAEPEKRSCGDRLPYCGLNAWRRRPSNVPSQSAGCCGSNACQRRAAGRSPIPLWRADDGGALIPLSLKEERYWLVLVVGIPELVVQLHVRCRRIALNHATAKFAVRVKSLTVTSAAKIVGSMAKFGERSRHP